MSVKKILAVITIFLTACAGWVLLGSVTTERSNSYFFRLGNSVESLWGKPLVQEAPSFSVQIPGTRQVRWMMPSKNDIHVELQTDYRKKGLLWYSTYICGFECVYTITNTEKVMQKIRFHFKFPAPKATYDDFSMYINGRLSSASVDTKSGLNELIELPPGKSAEFKIKYTTRGINNWRYQLDKNVGRVRNIELEVKTNFGDVDYTEGSLSPMTTSPVTASSMMEDKSGQGMVLTWKASDLITSSDIGIVIPEKLNPGPLTSRITYFAPICLIFFFILIATISIMCKINIHPMHYLFVAAGFFAFHLLLSYFAAHVNIHLAFMLSAITSVTLVTLYLSAALGRMFPWKVALAGQVFFLILFSYSFFIKGITGLTVAIGTVVTLGILMKVTAHVNWDDVFTRNNASSKTQMRCGDDHIQKAKEPPPLPSSG